MGGRNRSGAFRIDGMQRKAHDEQLLMLEQANSIIALIKEHLTGKAVCGEANQQGAHTSCMMPAR